MKKIYLLLGLLASAGLAQAQTCGTTVSTFPHIQDFETGVTGAPGTLPNGWTMAKNPTTSTYQWQVNAGSTSSTATGPNVDHSSGAATGKYVYTEASNGGTTDEAYLLSPCINLASLTTPGFEFWYHMAGPDMGMMEVQVSTNNGTTWTTVHTFTGPQQTSENDPWLKKTISLAAYMNQTVQIRWKGTKKATGNTFEGDMAVDDVKFFNIPPIDAELAAIVAPVSAGCGFTATENVTISIKNNGSAPLTSVPVRYVLGTNTVNETASVNIAPGATGNYTFNAKANLATAGTYTLTTTVLATNDGDPSNDSKTKTITAIPNVATFPYSQNFESGNGGWVASGANSSWAIGTPAKTVINSAGGGANSYVTNPSGNYNASEVSQVSSPCFNFSSLTAPVISMKVWWSSEGGWDGAVLQSSINGGASWQNVGALNDPNNWFNDNSLDGRAGGQNIGWAGTTTASSGGWVTAKHALTGLGGQSSVLLRVAFGSDGSGQYDGFAFDDVSIIESPAIEAELAAIVAPVASGCGFTATDNVTISIKNNGSTTLANIPVRYVLGTTTVNETTPATLTIAPGATANYTFTAKANLATAGTYTLTASVLVTNDGDPSNNSKSKTITVIPSVTTFPYSQNFESGNGGWIASGTNSSWAIGTPAKAVINSAGGGANSYVTNLTGTYSASEVSQVVGPCFNFSSLVAPIISMKVWWNSEGGWDGAVLQSSINGGVTWQNVGALNDPNNWFNDNSLDGRAGGQDIGWAGTTTASSGGWVTAKHALTGLGGQSSVQLRIAFGADGSVQYDGFAFDDISIIESPTVDAEVTAITSPILSGCGFSATENVTITIKNNGTTALANIPVRYVLGSSTVNETTPATLTIAPGQTGSYTFTAKANLLAGGTYTLTASVLAANDGDPSNNSITRTIINPLVSTFPSIQDFESGVSGAGGLGTLPAGWSRSASPVTTTYQWQVNAGPTSSTATGPNVDHTLGTAAGKYVYTEASNGTNTDEAYLISPCISLNGLTSPGFDFWYHMAGPAMGAMDVQVSANGGTTWTTLFTFTGPQQTAETDPWLKKTLSLAAYLNQTIQIRWKGTKTSTGNTFEGDMAIDDVKFYNIPSADAELLAITSPNTSGCGFTATENVCITIKNNGNVAITSIPVRYQIGSNPAVNETATVNIAPGTNGTYCFTTKANLATPGTYTLTVTTLLAADGDPSNDVKTRTINVLPTISTLPYTQNFENGNGGWLASGTNSSWAIGTPAKAVINSAGGGANSYVTGLTGTYNASEVSQVVGPCFNFSSVADPDFEMKAWWNSEGGWDGAVLQSSIDGGVTWQNVGALNDPNNWYNDNSLDGRAGGQDIGWAGTGSSSSGGWVRVKHKLNGLGGQSSVLLRIAFGADGSVQYDGFAFDDIRIGDNTNNLAVNSFVPLTKVCGFGNNEKVEVVLENLGSVPVTAGSYTVSYTVNNGTGTTPAVTQAGVALAPNVPVNFIFTTGANLTTAGNYTITVTVTMAGDPDASNNTITYTIGNATFTTIPPIFTFETPTTGIAALRTVKGINANITEGAAASQPLATNPATSTKGMIMEGVANAGWTMPAGTVNPWNVNPENFSAAYICFNPSGGAASDPLWLSFDLKQLFKIANANTNFRVTVNGVQVGATYRPPFSGTPINWQKVYVDLSAYKSNPNIQIGLESSVAEAFANGAGTANLIDNIRFQRLNPTGVDADILNSQLNVFPNPSAGVFNVSLPQGKAFAMEVTDLTGRVVMKETSAAKNAQVDLSKAAKGIYLLKVTSEGSAVVRKLIVE
jgi:hypothetical protein